MINSKRKTEGQTNSNSNQTGVSLDPVHLAAPTEPFCVRGAANFIRSTAAPHRSLYPFEPRAGGCRVVLRPPQDGRELELDREDLLARRVLQAPRAPRALHTSDGQVRLATVSISQQPGQARPPNLQGGTNETKNRKGSTASSPLRVPGPPRPQTSTETATTDREGCASHVESSNAPHPLEKDASARPSAAFPRSQAKPRSPNQPQLAHATKLEIVS